MNKRDRQEIYHISLNKNETNSKHNTHPINNLHTPTKINVVHDIR